MNNSMAQAYKNVISRITGLTSRRVWVKEPRHSETLSAEMRYLYRRTRLSYLVVVRGPRVP